MNTQCLEDAKYKSLILPCVVGFCIAQKLGLMVAVLSVCLFTVSPSVLAHADGMMQSMLHIACV